MNLFQEFFVTAMAALIFACIIVKLVSAAVSNNGRVDKEKVVVEEAKITKGLVVRSRKSKKRVKFVEQEVVGNVDHVETQNPNIDGVEGFVEEKIEGVLRKGDDFKGEKVSENLDLIEHCGGEREVSDGHDDAGVSRKIGLVEEKDEVTKIEEEIEGGEKILKNHDLIEHDADVCSKFGLLEEKDEVEKKLEGILMKGDDFKGEKVSENLDLIEHCGGEREVSDGYDYAGVSKKIGLVEEKDEVTKIEEEIEGAEKILKNHDLIEHDADVCSKFGLLEEKDEVEKKFEGILMKGDDFKGEKVSENLDLIEHCGGEREVSDVHEDADVCSKIEVMEEKVEVRKIDELVVVKDKDIANALAVDEVKVGETEVIEVGGGLSKGDDEKTSKMVIDEDSDDDWEGIERSELEEEFVKAVNFVNRGNAKNSGMENLGSELMMQLYGLQKIAMEGPCHEPQPMALKVYARAKWNAWQKMGSMNQEVAMEQYIKLLSDHVPKWTHHSKDDCEVGSSETKMPRDPDPIPDSSNGTCKDERTQEMNRAAEGVDFAGGEKDKE